MSHELIKRLYESELEKFAKTKTPQIPISYFNVKFDPVVDETYIRSHITPVLSETITLSGDHEMFIGIYQMAIIVKFGIGTALANNLAAELKEIFKVNRVIEGNGLKVQQITPLRVEDAFLDDTVLILPTSFNYRCDTN